jgi:hypothetical protein
LRFYALEAAELAARVGSKAEAVEHLREHGLTKMIGILAPRRKTRPKLVAA